MHTMQYPVSLIPTHPRALLWLMAAFSALALAGALLGQYGLGWHPCHLCLLQRYPYAAIMVLAAAGALLLREPRRHRQLAWLCLLLLAGDMAIALYHTGVEMGLIKGPSGCTNDAKGGQTLEEMRAAIMGAPLVTCDQAMAYILGLSLAAWNALAAGCMSLFCFIMLRRST